MPDLVQVASLRKPLASRPSLLAMPLALLLSACATVELPPMTEPTTPVPTAPVPPPVSRAEEEALRSLISHQDRLYRVAAPLLVGNGELCRNNARNLLGFTAKNKYSYSSEYVNAAEVVFGLGEPLQVMGVLPGSGAARAGVRRGDRLLAVEDKPLPQGENAERHASAMLAPLVTGRPSLNLTVGRNGADTTLNVPLTYACAFGIELGNADIVNAYGDGQRVLVTRGMMGQTRTDEELAYVMAKEMAHNVLGHASMQRMSATIGGIIDNLVRIRPDMSTMVGTSGVRPMPAEMDIAADRLSLYMLARAGYRLDNAIPFWQRLAGQYPATVPNSYTALHPNTQQRIAAMEKTIAEINARRGSGQPLVP